MFQSPGQKHPASRASALSPAGAEARIDPEQFIRDVEPLLEKRDLAGLIRLLGKRYNCGTICSLMTGPHADARKVAALALALVGNEQAVPVLAEHLRDEDPMVNQMAEHALWSIWFRGGTPEANERLLAGVQAMDAEPPRFEEALEQFSEAIRLCPGFAEAYNQRATAYYLQERLEESLRDGQRAVELMPYHFGAWASLGHCHAMRGELDSALECYRHASSINAHLHCLQELIHELESRPDGRIEEWTEAWIPRRRRPDCGKPRGTP